VFSIGLTSVVIPDSVVSIDTYAFNACTGLANLTLGTGITSIGSYAFYGCENLTDVVLPASIRTIGIRAFDNCPRLANLTTAPGNSAYRSVDGVLINQSGTVLIRYRPDRSGPYTIPDGITSIASYAFNNCANLSGVSFPDGLTGLGDFAFAGCTGLTEIVLPNTLNRVGAYGFAGCSNLVGASLGNGLVTLGNYAFYGCSGLSELTIPDSVIAIGDRALGGCTGLTNLTLGQGVTSIGSYAFIGCHRLNTLSLPASVTTIGGLALDGCSGLENIIVAGENPSYSSLDGVLFNKTMTKLIQFPAGRTGPYSIPPGVAEINNYAFRSCLGLATVSMPNSLAIIGDYAFSGCANLSAVDMGAGVIRIGIRAFENCSGLAMLMLPPTVTAVGAAAFNGLTGPLYFKGHCPMFDEINPEWPLAYYCANRTGWNSYPAPKTLWTSVAAFYPLGGTLSFASRTYDVGNPYDVLPAATRNGYVFAGWWTKKNAQGSRVYADTLVPYLTTAHSLYASWTLRPAIGAEDEVLFLADSLSFNLPLGYSSGTVEYATAVIDGGWNFVPLPTGEYEVSNGTLTIYHLAGLPEVFYRVTFHP